VAEALSIHYADALADAVFAPNSGISPQDAITQLRLAESVFASSKPLEHALLSPAVSKPRKKAVVEKLASQMALHRLLHNFLLVVVTHRRTRELHAMLRSFEAAVDARLGWVPAEIASAKELTNEQKKNIEDTLAAKLGKSIRTNYRVDPTLIGGVRARLASREYDASIKGKLESMRQRLAFRH
jgi:F-type H+-transporting ATPase subunit delta